MLSMLASIGIETGKPFEPDGERSRVLAEAGREGAAHMNDLFINHTFEPWWPNRQWVDIEGRIRSASATTATAAQDMKQLNPYTPSARRNV
jgi:hypothetical protein